MNEDPLTFTLTHIQYLVLTLNKKNFVTSSRHLAQLVKQFGLEADRHLLRCLFSAIDFGDPAQTARNSYQAKLLLTQLNALLNKSTLISNICFAVDNCFHNQKTLKASSNLLPHIAKSLSCSQTLEVVISLALTHSKNPELVKYADQHLKNNLPSLIESYVEVDAARSNQALGFSDLTIELLHLILSILAFDRHTKLGLSDQLYGKFIELLRTEFPQKQVPLVLAPLLYTEENSELSINHLTEYSKSILTINIMDTSWPNYVMEIGYAFTVSLEECKTHLMKPGGRDITAQDVAKVIALMCRTHSKFPENNLNLPTPTLFWVSNNQQSDESGKTPGDSNSGWKSEIFVQALKEAVPNLNWKDVCIGLDHSEFVIKDRAGLQILIHTIRLGIQSSGVGQNFPAECLYRHWNNVEGQLSLITIILKNPDVYSFADHIFTSVSIDSFKTNPESENKAIGAWKSLHLIEVLLYIAEKGFIPQVSEIFKVPVQQCPDLLFMGLLQISPPLTTMRLDLMNNLIPIFLNNHPNSGALLHNAWNSQNFAQSLRPIIMLSMSEWYSRSENDQSRLSRILDVAQDLKALSSLLNVRTFMFAIDLACLASRREYLKLEKWLTDKIRENGEPFVAVIVTFLQRRLPGLYRANNKLDEPSKTVQLPPETLNTIISCLQPCANAVQQDLGECIMQIVKTCNMQLRQSQTQPNALVRSKQLPMNLMHYPEMAPPFPEQFNLNSTMNAMNLGGNISNNFNFNNMLANMESTPGSPSHMLAPPQSPFHLSSQMNPTTMNTVPRMNPTPIGGDVFGTTVKELSQNVTKEIEDEVNSYFQRIYNHPPHPTLTIDEVLDTLQNFHNSPNKRERDIFSCMLRNLFEEYRFFPQYPEKELLITAQLFGGIIERNLVGNSATLGLALKCVLDAIKKPEGSKMYFFGITALERFKTKLPSLLKFAEQIRAIPHYSEFPEQIKIYVSHAIDPTGNAAAKPMLPASLSQIISSNIQGAPTNANPGSTSGVGNLYRSSSVTGNLTTTPTSKPQASIATSNQNAVSQASRVVKSIANATNIDTLLVATQSEEKVTMPPDNVQDKTAFIFNNLSQLNLPQKCDEIKELITKDYYAWLAQYMVLKRASIEFNFHVLYSNFLDALKNQEVIRLVTKETFRNIKVLLRSDKGIANFSDRSLLKNLGHWLGMMTLGRNKPILQIDIDLKSLLIEAYLKGQQELLYVVPFVAKVLEACAKSKVFKPPNPWTMAIMSVLAELHQEPDLKLNLKFEIEVLCKHLTLEIANIKPALYLKDPERARHIEFQLSQPKMQQPQTAIEEPQPRPASVAGITTSNTTNSPGPSGVGGVSDINASSWTMSTAQEPRFNYSDIQIGNIANIMPLISFPPGMNMVHAHPHLKQLIKVAFERTVTEWINPVIERSVRIAVQTTEQIIRKDFVMEPDENKMRLAAHALVRNLTAGHTLITIREQLMQSMSANLKKAFETALSPQSPEMLESAAIQLATENSELACCFMQKTAIEKALIEIDKRLVSEYEIRKLARKNHTQFFDNNVLTYQNEHMPEQIRLKVGGINPNQFATYNECAKNVPGFLPMSERDAIISLQARTPVTQEALPQNNMMVPNVQMQSHLLQLQPNSTYNSIFGLDEFNAHFDELGSKMEAFIKNASHIAQLQIQVNSMRELLETVFAARRKRDNASVITLLTKAVEGLMEGLTIIPEHVELMKLYRDIHLRIMRLLQDGRCFGAVFANRAITKCMLDCREEIRYNLEAVEILISSNYVNMPQFDLILSQLMDNGNNFMAVSFAMQLLQRYFLEERPNQLLSENDFIQTIDMLVRLVQYHRAPEGLAHMIDMLRVAQDQNLLSDRLPTGPLQFIHLGMMQARGADLNDEPPGFSDKTELLLKEWVGMYHSQGLGRDPLKTFGMFVNKMTLYGVIKTDDMITRFFRQATQLCMDLVYRTFADINIAPQLARTKIYQWIDAYVRLMALIIKHLGESGNQAMRINLLNKILGIVTGVLLQDQEMNGTSFQQIGYHRIFIMLFLELSAPEPVLENITVNVVTAFCHTYHILKPSMAPGFCYSWLELISHRVFIGRILATIPQQKGWAMYSQLLLDLFKYLAPFLRNAELAKPVQLLYKGTLKVLLILLHDFPEFLCDYHFGFCDVIPPNCIQMRNLILSAFPRNMRLPDPFTPNLKVDLLSEISASPSIYTNYMANIQPMNFKKSLDAYLKARAPVTFLSELRSQLQISTEEGNQYNIPLMNALVLYVGTQAISHIRAKNQVPNMTTIVHSAFMDIFQNLAVDLDTEGRYSFLNAIANQLRYPNSHTHYFSCVLLYLFVEANSEAIQEQITRVLLERLIVNRPHPWGLLITFIELIKNPVYKFWEHDFVHCAPEIEKLLESVARSCMVIKSNNQQMQNVEGELQECN